MTGTLDTGATVCFTSVMEATSTQEAKMASTTFTIEGIKIRTASQRRYVVVSGRVAPYASRRWNHRTESYEPSVYVAYHEIEKRSDSKATAVAAAVKHGFGPGGFIGVVDTTTGEVVYINRHSAAPSPTTEV